MDKLSEIRTRLNTYADSVLTDDDLVPTIEIDLELEPGEIGAELLADVAALAPFGTGNAEPLWLCRNLKLLDSQRFRSANGNSHLRLKLSTGDSDSVEAIWWKKGELSEDIGLWASVDAVFTLESNVGYGAEYRLRLQDVRPADCRQLAENAA